MKHLFVLFITAVITLSAEAQETTKVKDLNGVMTEFPQFTVEVVANEARYNHKRSGYSIYQRVYDYEPMARIDENTLNTLKKQKLAFVGAINKSERFKKMLADKKVEEIRFIVNDMRVNGYSWFNKPHMPGRNIYISENGKVLTIVLEASLLSSHESIAYRTWATQNYCDPVHKTAAFGGESVRQIFPYYSTEEILDSFKVKDSKL